MTYPEERDNSSKGLLIPHKRTEVRVSGRKGSNLLQAGSAVHQLVGEVEAHQGEDG